MSSDEVREFLATNSRAVLATRGADGSIQMSPVNAGVDGDGLVIISSREDTAKVKNLKRDPEAFLTAMNDDFYGPWARVEGTAEILSLPEAMEPLVDYYRRLAGEHPDWDDYRRAMVRDRRALIRMTIQRGNVFNR
ncbi:MAG: PPOX class F420-dependent oxidoreductase [Actinomycetota bacterium]|nr:PPOX class F420-dependent oxidoreductase [Actinomycetota bacterium]